jgi:hypothetical protein
MLNLAVHCRYISPFSELIDRTPMPFYLHLELVAAIFPFYRVIGT